jgi:cbb3-type cytochrome oxidase maturation protein
MSVILVLVAFSVTLAAGFLIAFFWSVRNGQYDDTYGSAVRILFDDDKPAQGKEEGEPADEIPSEPSPNQ